MILTIAKSTFKEAVRSRTFAFLIAIYTVAVLFSRLVGWISSTDGDEVTTSMVLSLQSVVGVLVAVATGTALMYNEIQQRTLYTVLSRPLPRWHFVVGKFLGMATGLAVCQAIMVAIGLAYLAATGAPVHRWLFLAGAMTTMEVLIMSAVSLCCTSLSTPLLAAVLGLAIYALGHAVHSMPGLMHNLSPHKQIIASVLASFIPDLGQFAYRNDAVASIPLGIEEVLTRLVYGLLWMALLVTVTVAVFRKKQL
jgi:ABC-type transport system involved in multi-copper enzyme maturation permease subunit